MQLVAYGAQDIYLTGNPQITFFKVVYRRHTNFSMECIEQTLNGSVGFNSRVTATISRNGDLVMGMHIEWNPAAMFVSVSATTSASSCMAGNNLLKEVALEIGGQQIDKHYRDWMSAWDDLTQVNPSKTTGRISGSGRHVVIADGGYMPATPYQKASFNIHGGAGELNPDSVHKAYTPLKFWFCRNPGLALPLIALQYHEVKVIIDTAAKGEMSSEGEGSTIIAGTEAVEPTSSTFKLYADYVYLDTDERRRFAQVSHEYLIEQVQRQAFGATATSFDLNFNHPVKELIWGRTPYATAGRSSSSPAIFQRGNNGLDPYVESNRMTLKLNGHERFTPRHPTYFSQQQVVQHHSGHGGVVKGDSVHVYSFALKPEEHQPSGTCNFSRIDNAQLVFTSGSGVTNGIVVYAINYNVLRIMSGMGGLAYSN